MSAWEEHLKPIPPPVMIVQDPLAAILGAIGDVRDLVSDLKDTDIAYVKARIDKQWLAIDDLEKRKADKTDMAELEKRVNGKVFDYYDKANDSITRVQNIAETSDTAFDSLSERLTEIEKETSKIGDLRAEIGDMRKIVNRLNRLSWQMAGAATTAGVLGLTIGFVLKMFVHIDWLKQFHFLP